MKLQNNTVFTLILRRYLITLSAIDFKKKKIKLWEKNDRNEETFWKFLNVKNWRS